MTSPEDRGDVADDVPVWRVGRGGPRDRVVREAVVELVLNGRALVRVSCLPQALEDLAVGFLVSEGLVAGADAVADVRAVLGPPRVVAGATEPRVSAESAQALRARVDVRADVDPDRLVAFRERLAISSGCGGAASVAAETVPRVASGATFRPGDLSDRMKEFERASVLFRETGGVHAAAATDGSALAAFAEDLGRHNAVDKAIGRCLREGADPGRLALLTTGRLSGDIIAKAARVGLPVVVSRGAITSRAIELARSADVAAAGFARGRRMNVYTAPWRLGLAARDEAAAGR